MTVFRCRFCRYETPHGHWPLCPRCHLPTNASAKKSAIVTTGPSLTSFATVDTKPVKRLSTGIREFDHVLGGGAPLGASILLFGPPKQGKTTLLIQCCRGVAEVGPVLYSSGEQKRDDIGPYVLRCGAQHANFEFMGTELDGGNIYAVIEKAEALKAKLVIIDSANVAYCDDVNASEGSSEQLRAVTNYVTAFGKRSDAVVIIVAHQTKDGSLSGPEAMKHLVDAIVEFYPTATEDEENEEDLCLRELWSDENRFAAGPGVARATLQLTTTGLRSWSPLDPKNPKRPRRKPTLQVVPR